MAFPTTKPFPFEFATVNPATNTLQDADSMPEGVLVVDGVDTLDSVVITKASTGLYKGAAPLLNRTNGELCYIRVTATVNGVTGTYYVPTFLIGETPTATTIADAVLTELVADHQAVDGSLADFLSTLDGNVNSVFGLLGLVDGKVDITQTQATAAADSAASVDGKLTTARAEKLDRIQATGQVAVTADVSGDGGTFTPVVADSVSPAYTWIIERRCPSEARAIRVAAEFHSHVAVDFSDIAAEAAGNPTTAPTVEFVSGPSTVEVQNVGLRAEDLKAVLFKTVEPVTATGEYTFKVTYVDVRDDRHVATVVLTVE